MTPEDWVDRWSCRLFETVPLLEEIPHPGLATGKHWKDTCPGTKGLAGRNHPEAGAFLLRLYADPKKTVADPMVGPGGLYLQAQGLFRHLYINDCEALPLALARDNLKMRRGMSVSYQLQSAASWAPPEKVHCIGTSPVFGQNHWSGAGEHQAAIRKEKNAHAVQGFHAKSPDNLANMPPYRYWAAALTIYGQMRSYIRKNGRAFVILRNYVRNGAEVDDVGHHLSLMKLAGWKIVGCHPRQIPPTLYNMWHVKNGRKCVDLEWAVVLQP